MNLELGKFYNAREVVKEYMSCNEKIGSYYIWKKYDYMHKNQDDGLRYVLQPLLNNMYRVHSIFNINNKNNR